MENALQIFSYEGKEIRTITEDNGTILFLASDVCTILEYSKSTSQVLKTHCKPEGVLKRYTPTSSGEQEMLYVTEPNLYRLIMKSKQPKAQEFERKVTEEILPTIRKTGRYDVAQKPMTTLDLLQSQLNILKEHEDRLSSIEHHALDTQEEIRLLKAKTETSNNHYFAIIGYASLMHKKVVLSDAVALGKKATSLCNHLGFVTGTIPDPRFGKVKTYPEDVLKEVFENYFK